MEYVFDHDGPDVGGLMRVMREANMPIPIFKASRDTDAEKGLVQLQAADYLAYEIRKFIRDHPFHKQGSRFPRKSLGALTPTKVRRMFATADRLANLCLSFGVKPRANP